MKSRVFALALAVSVALAGQAFAQAAVGTHSYSPLTGWTPDRYPDTETFTMSTFQKISWNKFNIGAIAGTGIPLANAGSGTGIFYAWPYRHRTVRLSVRSDLSASPSSALIYFFTSDDSAGTYAPVMMGKASGSIAGNFLSYADTTGLDTLKIYLPFRGRNNGAILEYNFPIPEWVYLGNYVKLFATKTDTTSGQVDSVTVSAKWVVRR